MYFSKNSQFSPYFVIYGYVTFLSLKKSFNNIYNALRPQNKKRKLTIFTNKNATGKKNIIPKTM